MTKLTFTDRQKLDIMYRNARQLLNTVEATFPSASFSEEFADLRCETMGSEIAKAQCLWSNIHQLFREMDTDDAFPTISAALQEFSSVAQSIMSRTASNYDVPRLGLGLFITTTAAVLTLPAVCRQCARSYGACLFFAAMVISYGAMMFASSYVEEEQQFWYWICSGWIFYLHIRPQSSKLSFQRGTALVLKANIATIGLLATQRIVRRWNQTGQKFTADPDIAHTFFSSRPAVMWALVALTYLDSIYQLHRSLPKTILPRLGVFILPVLALVFKVNFVANDAPELLAGSPLSRLSRSWPSVLSLVLQARVVFVGLACYLIIAIFNRQFSKTFQGKSFAVLKYV